MSREIKMTLSLLAVVAVAVMIFMFSGQKGDDSSRLSRAVAEWVLNIAVPGFSDMSAEARAPLLEKWIFYVRKAAHFSEFALFSVTLTCFFHYALRKRGIWPVLLSAWLIATLYADTDELHQMFVDSRGPALLDVCIDSAGALFGALLMGPVLWLRERFRDRRTDGAEKCS